MRATKIFWLHFRIAAMNEMQYRVNFFLSLFQSLLSLGVGLVVLGLVFGQVHELNGWSKPQLLAVFGVFTLLGGVIRMMLKPNVAQFMEDVENGTLDYILTKPVDAQLMVSTRKFEFWQGVDIVVGSVVLAVAVTQLGGASPLALATLVLGLVLAVIMVNSFLCMLATLAFWFIRIRQLIDMFEGIYQAGRWPISVYPGWLKIGLSLVVPVGIAVTVPASAVTGRLNGWILAAAALFTLVLAGLSRMFWKVGLRSYSGASA